MLLKGSLCFSLSDAESLWPHIGIWQVRSETGLTEYILLQILFILCDLNINGFLFLSSQC